MARMTFRLTDDMRDWLEKQSLKNGRTMNGEVVEIIRAKMDIAAKEAEQTYYTACMESGIEPIIPTEK